MKEVATIFTLVIFIVSLMPISIAQDLTDARKVPEDLEKVRLTDQDILKPTLTATRSTQFGQFVALAPHDSLLVEVYHI